MNIYLTNHADVRHTHFCTADGQVMYKSETPGFLHTGKMTTIYKIIPNDEPEDMSTSSCYVVTVARRSFPISGQICRVGGYRVAYN